MARQKGAPSGRAPGALAPGTLVLDNGAHTIKAGFSGSAAADKLPDCDADCRAIPNCIARSDRDQRTYVGAELTAECADFGGLKYRRPVEKGYIVNWESEKAIWERSILSGGAGAPGLRGGCEPGETNLVLTEAPNSPAALQRNADEMVFEEFGFGSYYRTIGA